MTQLANAIVFECCYGYWAWACSWPTREEYGLYYLRDGKRKKR